jgi:predicted CXXCH cytochrome family protein
MKAGAFYDSALPGGVGGNLGTDLSLTHPINFPVDNDSQADLNYVGTNTFMGPVAAQAIAAGVPASTVSYPLFKATPSAGQVANVVNGQTRTATNNYLECGSCHAVHDSGIKPFLRETMNKSTLCLGCHNK